MYDFRSKHYSSHSTKHISRDDKRVKHCSIFYYKFPILDISWQRRKEPCGGRNIHLISATDQTRSKTNVFRNKSDNTLSGNWVSVAVKSHACAAQLICKYLYISHWRSKLKKHDNDQTVCEQSSLFEPYLLFIWDMLQQGTGHNADTRLWLTKRFKFAV